VKAREVGRTIEIIAHIAAAAIFVVGDASSRDGRWSVGGEVDWQGLRRRVECKRAASSARLSVGLRCVQVDDIGCHCCGFFGSLERCGLYAQPYYYLPITACTRVPPAALKKKKSHNPQATGQNKSENCGPTTRRIDLAAVGRIKGIPIHFLEGSCSGYPLIPYSAASDACSRRCVNPAAILSSPRCATSRAAGAR
jgi:hypothetical protein